jgi:hypothetical protein
MTSSSTSMFDFLEMGSLAVSEAATALMPAMRAATLIDKVPSPAGTRLMSWVDDMLQEETARDAEMFAVFESIPSGSVHVVDWTPQCRTALCLFPNTVAMAVACEAFRAWLKDHGDNEASSFHLFDVLFNMDIIKDEVKDWFHVKAGLGPRLSFDDDDEDVEAEDDAESSSADKDEDSSDMKMFLGSLQEYVASLPDSLKQAHKTLLSKNWYTLGSSLIMKKEVADNDIVDKFCRQE